MPNLALRYEAVATTAGSVNFLGMSDKFSSMLAFKVSCRKDVPSKFAMVSGIANAVALEVAVKPPLGRRSDTSKEPGKVANNNAAERRKDKGATL